VEPFAGSACLYFDIAPTEAILGDINEELITFYRAVRQHPGDVHRRLLTVPRNRQKYAELRSSSPQSLSPTSRALRFLYLNRNCFNGIYRTNLQGQFNVPFGHGSGTYPTRSDILACATLLRTAKLINADFRKTLDLVEKNDFVYLDPPFAVESRRVFREYGEQTFSTADIADLAHKLGAIHRLGAYFLVSYADCHQARELANNWNAIRFAVRRNVAGFADQRRMAYEWLITNIELPATLEPARSR
jgi:DNA adenine methylase